MFAKKHEKERDRPTLWGGGGRGGRGGLGQFVPGMRHWPLVRYSIVYFVAN